MTISAGGKYKAAVTYFRRVILSLTVCSKALSL